MSAAQRWVPRHSRVDNRIVPGHSRLIVTSSYCVYEPIRIYTNDAARYLDWQWYRTKSRRKSCAVLSEIALTEPNPSHLRYDAHEPNEADTATSAWAKR